jgi:uncharacterized integral membrane protein
MVPDDVTAPPLPTRTDRSDHLDPDVDERPAVRADRRGLGVMAGVVALLLAGLLLVLLVVQNTQHAELHLLWFDADLSLSALVLGPAFVAIVVDEVAGLAWRRRRRRFLDLRDRAG